VEELGTREGSGIPLAVDVVLSCLSSMVRKYLRGGEGVTSENDVYNRITHAVG
jgi:hypothetical protein